MSEFDAAEAAVQAALDAGATYADARVMHRRYESMTARNGDVEDVGQNEDSGIGVRALVGSGWGFFAVPDLGRRVAPRRPARGPRRSPRRARWCRAAGHAAGRRRGGHRVVGERLRRSTRSTCRCRRRATCSCGPRTTMREHGADLAEAMYQIWETAQVVRVQRGPPHRPAHPRVRRRDHGDRDRRRRDAAPLVPGGPGPVRHAGLGAGRRDRHRGPRRPRRRARRASC